MITVRADTQSVGGDALRATNLGFSYGGREVLRDVSFAARRGEITAVVGQNGAGKSTLLNLISGFRKASRGAIYDARGLNLAKAVSHKRMSSGVARTFQDVRAFLRLSVIENVLLALDGAASHSAFSFLRRVSRTEAAAAMACLEWIGLDQLADSPASVLSFGQQRRLALAQILASRAEVVLLDEPTAGLDPAAVGMVEQKLVELNRDKGMSIMLIEHNLPFVRRVAHSVIYLNDGVVERHSTVNALLDDPGFRRSYLGVDVQ